MRYRSNLTAPDLAPYFRLREPALQILGHDIPSDPELDPGCGFLSHDEAAILYNVARQIGGEWVDLGARFGWSTVHLLAAGCEVWAIDHGWINRDQSKRFDRNMRIFSKEHAISLLLHVRALKTQEFLCEPRWTNEMFFDGFLIDADHDPPQPLLDAQGCARLAKNRAVIVLHDFQGEPVRDAVRWLIEQGWRCKVYFTPNGLAVCWRGDFAPPEHTPDPAIDWQMSRREMVEFANAIEKK